MTSSLERLAELVRQAEAKTRAKKLGAETQLPIPNSFPQSKEHPEHNYDFFVTSVDGTYPEGRWTQGPSIDGRDEFTVFRNEPMGEEPVLGPARPDSGAQAEQIGEKPAV